MIGIIAKLKIKAGQEKQFEETAAELVELSRKEVGCKGYTLWRTEDSSIYTFVEYYEDASGIEAHMQSEHYRRVGRQLGAFMDGKPEVIKLASVAC